MSTALLLIGSVFASSIAPGSIAELRYNGTLSQMGREGADEPAKRFSVYCLVKTDANGTRQLGFLVDERGGGGWAWPERFGMIALDAQNAPTNKARIQLLHDHNQTLYPLPVRQPVFEHAHQLEAGATWATENDNYEVAGDAKIKDRESWKIDVESNFGRHQTIWVEKASPLVVQSEQRVFMGQGDQFLLKMELDSIKEIDEKQYETLTQPLKTLVQLQYDLGRSENETKPELSDEQLKLASAIVGDLEKQSASTPFDRLAAVISRDVKAQLERSGNVATLAQKFVGQPAPALDLKSMSGAPVDEKERTGKTVVLHFWKYNDEPLTEPYGQVGYLDFLNSRRRKVGVQVYGVAVDPRLGEAATSQPALRQIRKLREFMNLGYPITIDDGTLLEKFGDPRRLGAQLPLWVVIGPDGKIAHYHAGYYDIKPDEGLRELDAVLVELIKQQRGSEN